MTAVLALCLGIAVNFAIPEVASADVVDINGGNAATYLDISGTTLNGFKSGVEIPNEVNLVIPDNITAIAAGAFDGRREILSVTLNEGLTATAIGTDAFKNCSGLVEVYDRTTAKITQNLGLTTTSLGRLVYSALNVYRPDFGASTLTTTNDGFIFCRDTRRGGNRNYLVGYVGTQADLTLPDMAAGYDIYQYAFWRTDCIQNVTIPACVAEIGEYAFLECNNLEKVVLPSTIKTIGNYAFRNNNGVDVSKINTITYAGAEDATGINLPEGLETIGAYAFSGLVNVESITIPASVEEIGMYAFEDCTKATESATLTFSGADVTVEEGATPLVIDRYAFYNCNRIKVVTLPARLTEMYRRVFDGCTSLAFAYMPDGVKYFAVDESEASFFTEVTTLIYENYETYKRACETNHIKTHLRNMTYIVNVNFKEVDVASNVMDAVTEQRLYGRAYKFRMQADKTWSTVDSATFPVQNGYASTVWYLDKGVNTAATFENVTELLRDVKDEGKDEIEIYALKLNKPTVTPVTNLVYDSQVTYYSSNWTSFITSSIGENEMNAYFSVKIDGRLDGAIHNAGPYALSVGISDAAKYGAWEEDVAATLTVGRRSYDIGQLRFRSNPSDNYPTGTLYIYTYTDGRTYPSLTRLSAAKASSLGVTYSTSVNVANSIVRYRNSPITIELNLGDLANEFEVTYTNNVQTDIGTHYSTARIVSKGNYELVENSEASSLYGLNVALADDVYSITKTWYIMMVENQLYTDSTHATPFSISGWTYTDTSVPVLPVLETPSSTEKMTFTLSRSGWSATFDFGEAEFGNYINSSMPTGDYVLSVTIPEVGDLVGYSVNFPFTVKAAKLSDDVKTEIGAKLTGKTFYHRWDREVHLYDKTNELSFLNAVPNPVRTGVWASTNYDNMYSTGYTLSYNLYRMLSNNYYKESDLNGAPASPVAPDTYTVYYQIEALNFESLIDVNDDEGRRNYAFTTIIYEAITVPTLAHATYTGYTVYPTIENGLGYYLELVEGQDYVKSGTKQVNLVLEDNVHSRWLKGNEEIMTEVAVDFIVDRGENVGTSEMNLIRWTWGSYDRNINIPIFDTVFTDSSDPDFVTFRLISDTDKKVYYYNPKAGQLGFGDAPAGTYRFTAAVKGYVPGDSTTEKYDWDYFETIDGIEVNIGKASNRWVETPNIIRWTWGEFDKNVNLITASPMHIGEGDKVKFSVLKANGSSVDPRLIDFELENNGTVKSGVELALKGLDAGTYTLVAKVTQTDNYDGLDTSATGHSPMQFNVMTATNRWQQTPNIIRWQYGQYDKTVNVITAVPAYGSVEYRIFTRDADGKYNLVSFGEGHEGVGVGTTAKNAFTVDKNGVVPDDVAAVLSQLGAGSYYLLATVNSSQVNENNSNYTGINNDNDHFTPMAFVVQKATNTWKTAPNILRWTHGNYNPSENIITALPTYGNAVVKIINSDGEECDINNLGALAAGTYMLTATVEGNNDYTGLNATLTFQIFEPTDTSFMGLQVASTVISALTIAALVAAAVIMLLPKKGGKK